MSAPPNVLGGLASPSFVETIPVGPRPDVTHCSGVFAIVGWRFTGSTLFGALAGTHPSLFDGGELHGLQRQPLGHQSQCAVCGRDCRYWTPDARIGMPIETLYHDVSRMFGRPFIVDGSKSLPWLRRVLVLYPDLPMTRIVLTKHPVRQLASEFGNAPGLVTIAECATALHDVRLFYEAVAIRSERTFESKYHKDARFPVDLHVRYEDLVRDPAAVLEPALARFGLDYDPRIAGWQEAEHHPIGGAAGSRIQRKRGIFLDNSYSDILDLDLISKIMRNPDAQWLCERFGYG